MQNKLLETKCLAYQPASLFELAYIKAVENKKDVSVYGHCYHSIKKVYFDCIRINSSGEEEQRVETSNRYWWWTKECENFRNSKKLVFTKPVYKDSLVEKHQLNDNARIERRDRVRKQLLPYFESKKFKIKYIE